MGPERPLLSRRRLLGALLAMPAAAKLGSALDFAGARSVKIDRIDVYPARYPLVGHFKFFTGPHGSAGRASVFVKVTASDGTVGWGQSVPIARWSSETLETATIALRDYYAPALLGLEATDIAGAHRRMDEAIAPTFSTGMPIARAGIDIALWDLAGKLAGKPLADLWGRPGGGRLRLSWTLNPRTLDEAEGLIAEGRARGYQNFNIKVAPDLKTDVELARIARRGAPDGFLWADANGGYDPETALEAARKLAGAGVDVLEAPLRPNRIRGYQALVREGALPIFMDEGVISVVELEEFIELGMLNGVAMKPARCGGLTSNREQIELVNRRGLSWLGSGLTDPDIALAAALILYRAYGLEKPAALNGPQLLATSVLRSPLAVEDGSIAVPRGPGLGIEVDEEKVREFVERTRAATGG